MAVSWVIMMEKSLCGAFSQALTPNPVNNCLPPTEMPAKCLPHFQTVHAGSKETIPHPKQLSHYYIG